RDVDQLLARQLEQREKRDDEMRQIGMLGEKHGEFAVAARLQQLQEPAHFRAHRKLFARDEMMAIDARALDKRGPRRAQVLRRHIGKSRRRNALEEYADRRKVALDERKSIDVARRLLHALVFEKTSNQLRARV